MKGLRKRVAVWMRGTSLAFYALLSCSFLAPATLHATVYTLTNKNSSALLNVSSSAGLESWTIDNVNQLNQQWFWFSVGSGGPQMDLSQITASPYVTTGGTRELTALYTNAIDTFGIQVSYTLTGQSSGSGKSGMTEGITVNNYSASSSLNFHLFMYTDMTLGGPALASSQYVQMNTVPGSSGQSQSIQTLGNFGNATNNFVVAGPASELEAALYPQTLNELTYTNGYTLNGNPNAGPGHVTWAMQWDMSIAPGASLGPLSMTDTLQVPEPSAFSFLAVGLGVAVAWTSRRRI